MADPVGFGSVPLARSSPAVAKALKGAKTPAVDAPPIEQLHGVVYRLADKSQKLETMMGALARRAGVATQGSGLRRDDPVWAAAVPALRPLFELQLDVDGKLGLQAERYVKLGHEQRELMIRENFASMMMFVLGRVFDGMELTPQQRRELPKLAENAIRLLESGS